MKASNAASASLLVSAIQISCSDRLAFGCWLFGSLLRTLAVLCTQQRCSPVVGHSSPSAFQKPSAPSATASSGAMTKPWFLKSSSSSQAVPAPFIGGGLPALLAVAGILFGAKLLERRN